MRGSGTPRSRRTIPAAPAPWESDPIRSPTRSCGFAGSSACAWSTPRSCLIWFRRIFLAGAAVAGATTALAPPAAKAAAATDASITAPRRPSALPPTMQVAIAETATPKELPRIGGVPGSDFMVDVIKTLDIKYLPSNPASSFRAIHESLINYGGNKMPEFLTCAHEESAVGMAHGYFKVAGKPLMTLCHGTVGLQHATMAVYNAWCDRVPVIVVGN